MKDMETLIHQIKKNCNISDAKYWGAFSICTFLFKLRELYRVENCIKPWEKIQHNEIDEWICKREKLWKELEDKDFEDIIIDGNVYGPFEVEKINTALEKHGLVYGAGFGVYMKPSFFLADLISKEKVDVYDIYTSGHEYARDLSGHIAMLQDKTIFARVDVTRQFLWEKYEELRFTRKSDGPLVFAFSKYFIIHKEDPSEDIYRRISLVAQSELETYIHHELGEAFEEVKIGGEWNFLLAELSSSRKAELFARSVKDILSDTSEKGMIKHIIRNYKQGSLGFYLVYLSGYRKLLFPEIAEAFQGFTQRGDWGLIDNARKAGYTKAKGYAERLLSIYKTHKSEKEWIPKYIEHEMLSELL
jgi:hypothetical protein